MIGVGHADGDSAAALEIEAGGACAWCDHRQSTYRIECPAGAVGHNEVVSIATDIGMAHYGQNGATGRRVERPAMVNIAVPARLASTGFALADHFGLIVVRVGPGVVA